MQDTKIELIKPGSFDTQKHYYPKVINAQPHPMVSFFKSLSIDRIINRYCHLKPKTDPTALLNVITYQPKYFCWAGVDLFHVATPNGERRMVTIETNSCPSGQKSMPQNSFEEENRGYKLLIRNTFIPAFKKAKALFPGKAAVLYDKNYMEVSGYAATIADELSEEVYLVPCFDKEKNDHFKFDKSGTLSIYFQNQWIPICAAFRYVTQKPWNRIPIQTKTAIVNPIISCLAGGRNKMVAAKAYDMFNGEIEGTGLRILSPETICDVGKAEIPFWIQKFGGHGVIKVPYSNAGQGVYTITSDKELRHFMELENDYDQYVVQSLIGNSSWSSQTKGTKYYHVGTVPNKRNEIYAADLRMLACTTEAGFRPLALYGRRAFKPLPQILKNGADSWSVLGTNLSIKKGANQWESDISRLILTDYKDFNAMGISFDELIEGYIQLVLAINAIDRMACHLINSKGGFKLKLFQSFDKDASLIREIIM